MKTFFSLKSRIGAILAVAAMLATAMPMTGFAATATTAPELMVNGDFSAVEAEGATYGVTDTVTLEAGTVPSTWELDYTEIKYTDNGKAKSTAYVTNKNVLSVTDDAFAIKQKVNGIEAGEFYTLSFDASTHNSANATVSVNFLNYDEATGKYSTLAEYAAANGVTLMKGAFGSESDTTIDFTSVGYTFRCNDATSNKPNRNYKLNFVAPPYTNAVEVVLHNDFDSSTTSSSAYFALFDNVSLKLGAEVVNNGNLQAFGQKPDETTGAYEPQFWQRNANAAGYREIAAAGAKAGSTYLLLNANSKYRLTFKYKHTIGELVADKTPNIVVTDMSTYSAINLSGAQIGTDGEWGIYETYFTTDDFAANDAGLVNLGFNPATRALEEGETWEEGYAAYYDDFSIVEATTMNINAAGGVDVSFTPAYAGDTADLIVAKYNKVTGELDDIEIVAIGEDAEAGVWYNFTQAADLSSNVKVFLWDGIGTMKPITSTLSRASYTKTVPYAWRFETVDSVPTLADGIGYNATGANGSLSVTAAGLTLKDSTVSGVKDSHRVDFSFDPVSTGKLYAELQYTAQQAFCHDGMMVISDSNGNRIAGLATEGRGATGTKVWNYNSEAGTSAWSGKDITNGATWKNGATVKLALDFTAGTYTVYQNGTQLSSASLGDTFKMSAGAASKLTFNYSENGDALKFVRIYTEEVTATPVDEDYTLNVGATQQVGITYEPAGSTVPDMVYASSNTAIAEVSASGLITAKRAGTATITAKSAVYDVDASWDVTVTDTTTVTPVALAYEDTFATADGQEIKDLAGWSILNRQPNTVLATADGKLVATGITAADRFTGAAQAKLAFQPVSSGKLVIELDYKNLSGAIAAVSAANGLLSIYATDGTKVAGIRADGRGTFGLYTGSAQVANDAKVQARYFNDIKIELDLTAKTYQVWSGETAITAGGLTAVAFTDAALALAEAGTLDVSSVEFTFTNEGDYIENVMVYVPNAE